MKRYLFCLLLFVSLTTSFAYGQHYQGSASVGGTVVGMTFDISNGVMFDKDYVGLGVEYGAWWLLVLAREWGSVYADYRHHFRTGEKSSFFLQASPGVAYSEHWEIGDKSEPKDDDDKVSEKKILFNAKAGAGFAWQFKKCGVAVSIQNSFFTPTRLNYYLPTLQLSFLW